MNYSIVTDHKLIDRDYWSRFIYKHPKGNIFQTPEMFEVYFNTPFYEPLVIFVTKGTGEIVGLLQAFILREKQGIIGTMSSRAIIWGGPLIHDDRQDIFELIIHKYNEMIQKLAVYSQYRNIFCNGSYLEKFLHAGYQYKEHLNVLFDLTKNEELLWSEIHRNRRKEIKKGYKKGLIVKELPLTNKKEIENTYQLLFSLYKDIGLPVPSMMFFMNSIKYLGGNKYFRIFGTYIDDKLIGFRYVLTYRDLIYDWYAASDRDYLEYRPNDVLPWEIIRWGIANEYKSFDFGGAGNPNKAYGVRDYKIRFGGKLVEYGRFEKIHKPLIMKIGILGKRAYKYIG